MQSFYGGPNGLDFNISWIFHTKYGDGNSMENDINRGWESPIGVGSYVMISYGEAHDENDTYRKRADLDINLGSYEYNSTLWLKVYDENVQEHNGLGYTLITSMAGYTPRVKYIKPIDVLDADQLPDISFDDTYIDRPTVLLHLPLNLILGANPLVVLNADEDPKFVYDDGIRDDDGNLIRDELGHSVPGTHGGTINDPIISFYLPLPQITTQATEHYKVLDADQLPEVIYDNGKGKDINGEPIIGDYGGTINRPKLVFKLPREQVLSDAGTLILNANLLPQFQYDDGEHNPDGSIKRDEDGNLIPGPLGGIINFPLFLFRLPQPQVLGLSKETPVILHADENPEVIYDDGNGTANLGPHGGTINTPTLTFKLPRGQRIKLGTVTVIKADEQPKIFIDFGSKDNNGDVVPGEYGGTIDEPTVNYWLPVSQVLQQGENTVIDADLLPYFKIDSTDIDKPVIKFWLPKQQILSMVLPITILNADEMPEVIYDDGTVDAEGNKVSGRDEDGNLVPGPQGGTINDPTLTFKLPQSQRILLGTITPIDCNQLPRVELDLTNINKPTVNYWLPVSLVMLQCTLKVVAPVDSPTVYYNDNHEVDINKPYLEFELPRATRFYYGELLGKSMGETILNDNFADYMPGDYYIHEFTGRIYIVKEKFENNTVTFDYVTCLQPPIPEIEVHNISPYTKDLDINSPTIEREVDTETKLWKLLFGIPTAPKPSLATKFIAPALKGNSSVEILDEDTIHFMFNIPRGTRLFADVKLTEHNKDNHHVEEADLGDFCLNPENGKMFIYMGEDKWVMQEGSLKGPVGDALKVVKSYWIDESEIAEDSLELISLNIQEKFLADLNFWEDTDGDTVPDLPRLPYLDELIEVTYWFTDINGDKRSKSYWYHYSAIDGWTRVILTGDLYNAIQQEYDAEDNEYKMYSIQYINKLINDRTEDVPEEEKTKKTLSARWIVDQLTWGVLDGENTAYKTHDITILYMSIDDTVVCVDYLLNLREGSEYNIEPNMDLQPLLNYVYMGVVNSSPDKPSGILDANKTIIFRVKKVI